MYKTSGNIINLYMFAVNENHMMYGSWDMEHDRHDFLSFWVIFCPFTPLTTWKIKILKKWKKHLEISSFYTYVQLMVIIRCIVSEILSVTGRKFSHFGHFLPFYNPENENFEKMKKYQAILSFYRSVSKIMIICYAVTEILCMIDVICIFHFGLFFCPFTPLTAKKLKI